MTDCSCEHPLNDSQYMQRGGLALKSCPRCSVQAGRHLFHALSSFGMRTMADGQEIVQSWCPACRSNSTPDKPAYACR